MKRIRIKRFIYALMLIPFLGTPCILHADEGMWLPVLIQQKILDMQKLGCELSAEDIYSVNQACLKDAIVIFGGGCTGELISSQGLLITNHHCGYGQIQAHSSVEHDYLKDGFWAMSLKEELPNSSLRVTFLRSMEDVTAKVIEGTANLDKEQRSKRISENMSAITKGALEGKSKFYSAYVAPLFYGNQYFLYINESYADVRLVGAPPSSIGKFGGDTDNWMWPRHTGDFSLFRVYANAENQPAEYSTQNVPYQPKKHLVISTKGVNPGDFTMVYGYPGRTQEYILSPAVDYIARLSDPHKIHLRTIRLDIMSAEQEKSQAVRIQYSSKHAGVANAWKKWQGEAQGIDRLGTVAKKQDLERRFQQWANQNNKSEYKDLIPAMKALYQELEPIQFAQEIFAETLQSVELFQFARSIQNQVTRDRAEAAKSYAENFFKNYYLPIDKACFEQLSQEYFKALPNEVNPKSAAFADTLFTESVFTSKEKVMHLLSLPKEEALEIMKADPACTYMEPFNLKFAELTPKMADINRQLNDYYPIWMRGLMEFDKTRVFFPDANMTLRVAYGTVEGYRPADGITFYPISTLEGIMQKDNPNIFDYNIPQSLRDIYASKDYGQWETDGTIPVCFLATNHTSGGNSGSPVLNAKGQLLGLNFDRVWEGTMSDIEFDPTMCRNISVDIRYVLFVIDRIGKAGYLLNEMDFN